LKSKRKEGLESINKTGSFAPAKGDWPPKDPEPRKKVGEWPTEKPWMGKRMRA
jgi:hypothetical protein